jgi:hypothetical protein
MALENLSSLIVGRTQIGNAGLKELKDLTKLSSLLLGHIKVGDAGLKEIRNLKNLLTLQPEALTSSWWMGRAGARHGCPTRCVTGWE